MRSFNAGAGMKRQLAALVLIALAGCGQRSGPVGNTIGESVDGAPAESMLRPGKWQITAEEARPTSPGGGEIPVPTELPKSNTMCITRVEAATLTPESLPGSGYKNCKRESSDVSNGNINAQLICPGMDDIKEVPTRISGSYSREEYRITTTMQVFGMSLEQRIEAHRIGECD